MQRNLLPLVVVITYPIGACSSSGGSNPAKLADAATRVDARGGAGAGEDMDDGGDAASTVCTLGAIEHCGKCNNACPGTTDDTNEVVCSMGKCSITCKGEHYDVDGMIDTGCEAEDAKAQDTAATAMVLTLPAGSNVPGNPLTITGAIYGDARLHDPEPVARPLGREDWYKVSVTGIGDALTNATTACLDLGDLPNGNTFEVCISDSNQVIFDSVMGCKTVKGGPGDAACVTPPRNTDAGVYFVKVRKVAGRNSEESYSLTLRH